ncbi:MAG: hypothetical protein LDL31_02870 [Prosthecobacter sp.]|nr:hypothetical protein [Prosthecobacter sp.]
MSTPLHPWSNQIVMFRCAIALCLFFALHLSAEPPGQWHAPDPHGLPWKHVPTGLSFPATLGTHRLAGEFRFSQGGGLFIRYESLEERSRGDIYFIPVTDKEITLEERQRLIMQELDRVVHDLRSMEKQGRYKNLKVNPVATGGVELWEKDPLPMAAQLCEMTRVAQTPNGTEEAKVKQWTGILYIDGFLITIRQMRGSSGEDEDAAGMQAFAGQVLKVIKDPPLRRGVAGLIERYLEDPFSEDSVQATAAVLAYLKGAPDLPISIPEHPVQDWLEICKKQAPGTDEHLLRAFMLGAARQAFAGGSAKECINAGAVQFAKIYRALLGKHPELNVPGIDAFLAATAEGKGGEWLLSSSLAR